MFTTIVLLLTLFSPLAQAMIADTADTAETSPQVSTELAQSSPGNSADHINSNPSFTSISHFEFCDIIVRNMLQGCMELYLEGNDITQYIENYLPGFKESDSDIQKKAISQVQCAFLRLPTIFPLPWKHVIKCSEWCNPRPFAQHNLPISFSEQKNCFMLFHEKCKIFLRDFLNRNSSLLETYINSFYFEEEYKEKLRKYVSASIYAGKGKEAATFDYFIFSLLGALIEVRIIAKKGVVPHNLKFLRNFYDNIIRGNIRSTSIWKEATKMMAISICSTTLICKELKSLDLISKNHNSLLSTALVTLAGIGTTCYLHHSYSATEEKLIANLEEFLIHEIRGLINEDLEKPLPLADWFEI